MTVSSKNIFVFLTLLAIALPIGNAFAASPSPAATPKSSPSPAAISKDAEPQPTVIPNDLKLDATQKKKIADIRADRRKQIEAVLTAEQKTKYAEGLKNDQKLGTVLKSLNLKPEQKAKIKAIIEKTNDQVKAVLTPEQLKALTAVKK